LEEIDELQLVAFKFHNGGIIPLCDWWRGVESSPFRRMKLYARLSFTPRRFPRESIRFFHLTPNRVDKIVKFLQHFFRHGSSSKKSI
jgi:hypothetical protein